MGRGRSPVTNAQDADSAEVRPPSFEFVAEVDHEGFGKHTIAGLASLSAPAPDEVPAWCVGLYMEMTCDAIRPLFDPALFAEPAMRLVSVTDPGEAIG